MTLVRRKWSDPFGFWTVDHKGQRSIVKGLNKNDPTRGGRLYRRWYGVKTGFGKDVFLVPYKKAARRTTNTRPTTKTSITSAQKRSMTRSSFRSMRSATVGTAVGRGVKKTSRAKSSVPTAPRSHQSKAKPALANNLLTELEELEVGCIYSVSRKAIIDLFIRRRKNISRRSFFV